jgi:hypothetical protein
MNILLEIIDAGTERNSAQASQFANLLRGIKSIPVFADRIHFGLTDADRFTFFVICSGNGLITVAVFGYFASSRQNSL